MTIVGPATQRQSGETMTYPTSRERALGSGIETMARALPTELPPPPQIGSVSEGYFFLITISSLPPLLFYSISVLVYVHEKQKT